MLYEQFQFKILRLLRPVWNRVVSFDLETNVKNLKFLTDERILAISLARRKKGNLMESKGVEIKTLFLKEDTNESEIELLRELGSELDRIKPLCVLGYGIRQYDIPLMAMKKQYYGKYMKAWSEFWKIVDFIESAVHIDLYHLLKYKRYRKFEEALNSSEFAGLPLKKTKRIVTENRKGKALEIYNLWKRNKEKLKNYIEGDVHDALLIAEKLVFG